MKFFHFVVIGGGIVGLATAYKLQRQYPKLKILVLEKEDGLATHQTGRNSGVLHSGIYYQPGSRKSQTCISGRRALVAFVKKYDIPHDICGKVIVATHERELPLLEKIYRNGIENGVEEIEYISDRQIVEIEPYCRGLKGVSVGCTGIVDFVAVTNKLAELIHTINPSSQVLTKYEVLSIRKENDGSIVTTQKGDFKTGVTIFCAGLQADRTAKMDGVDLKEQIVGFRGDYYELAEVSQHKVKHLIYPVPDPDFPFLGVHFTRMITGGVECGPNAVLSFKREGYSKTDFNWHDAIDVLSYQGTWKLFFGHFRFALDEYKRAFSKRLFLRSLQKLIPSLTMADIKPGRAGVRAVLLSTDGNTTDDFRIENNKNSIHVLNAPSPAATAALAIGDEVVEIVKRHRYISGY